MIVYLAMLTFICVLAMGSLFLPRRLRVIRPAISLVGYSVTCVFIGLRDQVGADWDTYKTIFTLVGTLPMAARFLVSEPGYVLFNRLVYLAGGDIHLVNLICATILLVCLFNFSRLVEMDSNLLLFVAAPYLLFVVGMGYTRQSVALGLALNAVGYLRHKRERMFYLFAFLATLFHYSAIFLVLLWWIKNFKRAAIVLLPILAILPLVIPLLASGRYVKYVNNDPSNQSHGVWTRILLVAFALLIILNQKIKWVQETELRKIIFRGTVALGMLCVLSIFLSTLADRICVYLFVIYLLAMGSVIRNSVRPYRFLSLLMVVSLSYALFVAWFGFSTFATAAWFPYKMSFYTGT
jgi:hypothetical protein